MSEMETGFTFLVDILNRNKKAYLDACVGGVMPKAERSTLNFVIGNCILYAMENEKEDCLDDFIVWLKEFRKEVWRSQ